MTPRPRPSDSIQNWRPMLAATPVRNTAATVERLDGNTLRISVPRQRPRFLVPPISWILRPSATRTLFLDTLGSQVWELSDSSRTFEAIVETFAARHGLTFHEARVAAGNYIRQLMERGALAIAMPSDG